MLLLHILFYFNIASVILLILFTLISFIAKMYCTIESIKIRLVIANILWVDCILQFICLLVVMDYVSQYFYFAGLWLIYASINYYQLKLTQKTNASQCCEDIITQKASVQLKGNSSNNGI